MDAMLKEVVDYIKRMDTLRVPFEDLTKDQQENRMIDILVNGYPEVPKSLIELQNRKFSSKHILDMMRKH